jgi:hypothetical protein
MMASCWLLKLLFLKTTLLAMRICSTRSARVRKGEGGKPALPLSSCSLSVRLKKSVTRVSDGWYVDILGRLLGPA